MRKYGLTVSAYKAMLTNPCAICGSRKERQVDHCHKTGVVRGTLCRRCNSTLGFVNDDTEILLKMVDYLGD